MSGYHHGHGGAPELYAHDAGPGAATLAPATRTSGFSPVRFGSEQVEAVKLGTLYALGHGAVVIALGIAALAFGAILPDWLDPIMGRIVGLTLVFLGLWVLYSVYRYARGGELPTPQPLDARLRQHALRLAANGCPAARSRACRASRDELLWPENSGVGIHGIGAETGTQVLLIAAVGGAAAAGLGVPMLFAFVLGLLISNLAIVVLTSVGFVASQTRERIYVLVGLVAGLFSLILGTIYVLSLDAIVPEMDSLLPF